MNTKSIILLIISTQVFGGMRRQFNHYSEFLEKQKAEAKKAVLRYGGYKDSELKHYFSKTDEQVGPIRNKFYNPMWGYEPYWMGGDWVFNRTAYNASLNCGHHCFEIYEKYGPICAVTYKNVQYKSFANICAMRTEDCYDRHMWRIIYRGECRDDLKLYPYPPTPYSLNNTGPPMTRARTYINAFVSLNPTYHWRSRRLLRRGRARNSTDRFPAKHITHVHKKNH